MQKKSAKIGSILGGLAAVATVVGVLWGQGLFEPDYVLVTDAKACGTKVVEVREQSGPWPECRHQSHGLEKYRKSKIFQGKSGWRDGGKSQPWWCSQLEARHASGFETPYAVSTVDSSEESQKDWKGHVEYEYYCKVRFDYDPLWRAERSSACGDREFVTVEKEEPATCEVTRTEAEAKGLNFSTQ
jgi:hypothetical protein